MSWEELDKTLGEIEDDVTEAERKKAEQDTRAKMDDIDKIFLSLASTEEGDRFLEYLRERYIDTYTVASPGMDPLEIGIRQGRVQLVREIFQAIERASLGR